MFTVARRRVYHGLKDKTSRLTSGTFLSNNSVATNHSENNAK